MGRSRISAFLDAFLNSSGQVQDGGIADLAAAKLTGSRTLPKGVVPAGSVLQVVQSQLSTFFNVSAATQTDLTGLSLSITPSSSSSKILIVTSLQGVTAGNAANSRARFMLTDGSNALLATISDTWLPNWTSSSGFVWVPSVSHSLLHSPNSTSALTYKIRIYTQTADGCAVNNYQDSNYKPTSTITALEISA